MSNWTTSDPPDDLSTVAAYAGSSPNSERYLNSTYFSFTTTLNNSNVTAGNTTTSTTDVQLLIDVGSYLWKVLSPILFIVGILGNTLSVIIFRRMRFWMKPSLFFLVPLALTDMTVLCVGLSRYWVREMFDYDLRITSEAGCKINLFVIYISMQFSSWILVCFTFERFLKTNFPFRYIRVMTVNKEIIALVILFVFLVCVDGHLFWTNGLVIDNGTLDCSSLTIETYHFDEYVFVYIDLAFLSVLPAVLMLIMNVCIIRVYRRSIQFLRTSTRGGHADNRQRYSMNVTKMLLLTNSYFLFATLPICLYFIVDSYTHTEDNVLIAKKDLAWSVVYILQFSNYTMNFFLYVAANDKFRLHLINLVKCRAPERFSRRRSSAYSAQNTSTFRLASEDSETMVGASEGERNNDSVSPPSHVDSVTTSNRASVPSLSGRLDRSKQMSNVPWSMRVQQFNSANPSVTDATV